MKKLLATVTTGVMIAGAAATSVSAEEYNVQKGDSLWDIADEYSTSVDDLVKINNLDTKVIHPDQKLSIDKKEDETYTVKQGDTLNGISKKFDVKTKDIKEWNDLDSDLIVIGQELELKDVAVDQSDEDSSDHADSDSDNNEASDDKTEEADNNKKDSKKDTEDKDTKKTTTENETTEQESESDDAPEGETISVSSTAYTANCDSCSGVTATGVDLNNDPDAKVIAVDPDVIPMGSEVYVEGYGKATAADTGGAINGKKIDVHVPDKGEATDWGVKDVDVTILD